MTSAYEATRRTVLAGLSLPATAQASQKSDFTLNEVWHQTDWPLLAKQIAALREASLHDDRLVGLANWLEALRSAAENEDVPGRWMSSEGD